MGPGDLARALCGLPLIHDPNLLVGMERGDDAGVYQLTAEIALVQTVDFFTPIVDDPYVFGQIAAANALSDVYAMGGTPLTAMNLVCFPVKQLEVSILQQTLKGGLQKIREAGAVLVGGHSIEDQEFKYGLSVTGLVHPERVLVKRGARAGDRLVLTKPLGTGMVATAIKASLADADIQARVVASMSTLNRRAAEVMREFSVHACTDVTGFGLLGHAGEMVEESEVGLVIQASAVPVFSGVKEYSEMGLLPGGLHRNREFRIDQVELDPTVPRHLQDALFDPQTSGGLLIALPAEETPRLLERLHRAGIPEATVIGEVVSAPAGRILVRSSRRSTST